jgi:hypothetical protein
VISSAESMRNAVAYFESKGLYAQRAAKTASNPVKRMSLGRARSRRVVRRLETVGNKPILTETERKTIKAAAANGVPMAELVRRLRLRPKAVEMVRREYQDVKGGC